MLAPLSEDALRQYIDARTALRALHIATKAAHDVRGGMMWRTVNQTEYLVRTGWGGSQKGLGRRTEDTEAIYRNFTTRKQEAESRVATLKQVVIKHQRLNRALYVGRVPKALIAVLNMLAKFDLIQFLTVVGPCAMFAYESAAGVRIESADPHARQESDGFGYKVDHLQFISRLNQIQERSIIYILKKVDPTFKVNDSAAGGFTAVNAQTLQVDFIRAKEAHLLSLSNDEDHQRFSLIQRSGILISAPQIEVVVVGATGEMAIMPTISPFAFYQFKLWMEQQNNGQLEKSRQDNIQAFLVLELMQQYLPQFLPVEFQKN